MKEATGNPSVTRIVKNWLEKTIFKGLLFAAILIIALAMGSKDANANIISYTETFSLDDQNSSATFTFSSFNTSLGVLTNAVWTISATMSMRGTVTNLNAYRDQSFTASPRIYIMRTEPRKAVSWIGSDFPTINANLGPSLTYYYNSTVVTDTSIFDDPKINRYLDIVVGDYADAVRGLALFHDMGVYGNYLTSQSTGQAHGTLTLTYVYDPAPVPIPAAAYLFGSGLLGLISIRMKMQKQKTS